MKKINVKDLYRKTDELLNQDVILEGWVRTTRASKDFGFIDLNDGDGEYSGCDCVSESGEGG